VVVVGDEDILQAEGVARVAAQKQRVQRFGFAEGWLDSAVAVTDKAISIDPNLAEAYKALGLAYQMKGWIKKGIEAYGKAVELNPNYFPAVGNTGFSYWFLGRYDDALPWMKKALALNPSFPYNYLGAGVIYASLGKDDEAEEQLVKSLELQPDFSFARLNLALLYLRQGNDQQAANEIRKISTTGSDDVEALTYVAQVLLYLGKYAEARPLIEKAASLSTGDRRPTTPLGFIYWKANQKENAREMFHESLKAQTEALQRGNEGFFAPYAITAVNAIQGNKEEAYKWFRKTIDAGWRDYRLGQRDPLLENLRDDEQFKQMMAEVKAKVDEMRMRVEQQESND